MQQQESKLLELQGNVAALQLERDRLKSELAQKVVGLFNITNFTWLTSVICSLCIMLQMFVVL